MVGSFVILAIVVVLRIMAETLLDKFGWLDTFIPYLNWAVIIMAVVFVVFTVITLLAKLLSGGSRRR